MSAEDNVKIRPGDVCRFLNAAMCRAFLLIWMAILSGRSRAVRLSQWPEHEKAWRS
jgi:hypothetical protein